MVGVHASVHVHVNVRDCSYILTFENNYRNSSSFTANAKFEMCMVHELAALRQMGAG